MRVLCCLILSCMCFVGTLGADTRLITELYEKSGLKEELSYIGPSMLQEFDRNLKETEPSDRAPAEIIQAARTLMAQSFPAEKMKDTILAEYEAKLTEDDLKTIIKWLDTPLGKKCTQLEIASSTPESETKIQAYIAGLSKNPPPAERLKLVHEYERKTGLTQGTATMLLGMQLATEIAFNALFVPPEKQRSLSEMSETVERHRTMLEGTLRPELVNRLLYTYRSLSDAELKKVIEFESSAVGKKYTQAALSGVQKALVDGTAYFSKNIFQVIKEFKDKPSA